MKPGLNICPGDNILLIIIHMVELRHRLVNEIEIYNNLFKIANIYMMVRPIKNMKTAAGVLATMGGVMMNLGRICILVLISLNPSYYGLMYTNARNYRLLGDPVMVTVLHRGGYGFNMYEAIQ